MVTNHNWLDTHLPSQQMRDDLATIADEIKHIRDSVRRDVKLSIYVGIAAVVLGVLAFIIFMHAHIIWFAFIIMVFAFLSFLSTCEILAVAFNKQRLIYEMKRLSNAVRTEEAERIGRTYRGNSLLG